MDLQKTEATNKYASCLNGLALGFPAPIHKKTLQLVKHLMEEVVPFFKVLDALLSDKGVLQGVCKFESWTWQPTTHSAMVWHNLIYI